MAPARRTKSLAASSPPCPDPPFAGVAAPQTTSPTPAWGVWVCGRFSEHKRRVHRQPQKAAGAARGNRQPRIGERRQEVRSMPAGRPKANRQLAHCREAGLCCRECVRAAADLLQISSGLDSSLTRLIFFLIFPEQACALHGHRVCPGFPQPRGRAVRGGGLPARLGPDPAGRRPRPESDGLFRFRSAAPLDRFNPFCHRRASASDFP